MDQDPPLTHSPEAIARACLCYRVQRASRAVGRRFDDALRPLGLTNWQFTLLTALAGSEAPTVGETAAELGMDRTTTTKNLRPLERRGLLEIRADADDGRVRRIVLTDAARQLLDRAMPAWERTNRAAAAGLSPAELATLHRLLGVLAGDATAH